MPNRLAQETSPYLLQHQDNPVDWYPWGEEALAHARETNRPLLVSIGYSACHWCHVMAHESFEDEAIAAFMNEHFVCIKVDREERPDIDAIYMTAVQGMTGHGGWPLNAFCTPEGVPFFGGTYWPPSDRRGMPGFPRVLQTIAGAWASGPEGLLENAEQMRTYLNNSATTLPSAAADRTIAEAAITALEEQFDRANGGFGTAPKFPQAPVLDFLLRHAALTGNSRALEMATTTLDHIADGGIHDQLGGGFARYAVDETWLTPHFEKMLYDNAQLLEHYVNAFKLTGNERYRRIAEFTIGWLKREMLSPEGAFHAALDADSEGEEGKYYTWRASEVDALLTPEEADLVRTHWGVTEGGNFEHGTSILHIVRPLDEIAAATGQSTDELARLRGSAARKLCAQRDTRIRPGLDDKIITSWNATTVKALAAASDILDDEAVLAMARHCASFLLDNLRTESGHLRHTWKGGQTRGDGLLEDYASMIDALISLYQRCFEDRWLQEAEALLAIVLEEFRHDSGTGFYDTGTNHERLVTRPRDLQDNATPSGNAVMADVLITIGAYRQDETLTELARAMIEGLTTAAARYPTAFGRVLAVQERLLSPVRELVFTGPATAPLVSAASRLPLPDVVTGYVPMTGDAPWPMLADRPVIGSGAAYLCQNSACLPPVTDAQELTRLLMERPAG